jgi:hypothetical protein
MNSKTLVILAGLVILTMLIIASCAQPTPEVKTIKETVVVKETVTVKETVIVKETVPPPTAAPQPTATPRPLPPTARLVIEGTGLTNVPVNTPVKLMAEGLDPKVPITRTTWTLTAPPGSQAKLKDPAALKTEFTPDIVGTYKVDVVPANAAGSGPMASVKIHAGTLVGDNEKNCKTCHPAQVTNYAQTVHAKAKIECEQCHGPASQHLKGEKVMVSSLDDGVCDVCHNTPTLFTGASLKNAKHYTGKTFEEVTGPARQACARCHSGVGYISFLKNPTNIAAWENQVSYIGCSVCHDPHARNNFAQLRFVGKPIALPFEAKDVGLSATCYECHNARTKPADAIRSVFPHFASHAEFLSDTGGVTYGATVPNSPHGILVGNAPVSDPTDKTKMLFGGQVPGPCVVCHMWPLIAPQDPNAKYRLEVGGHSFNTKSVDGKFEYTASCKACHGDIKDFNLKAKADYDGNGKVEGVKEEIKGLLNALWKALEARGVKRVDTFPYATLPRDAQGNVDDKIDNAFYNFRTVYGVMWSIDADGKLNPGNEGAAQAMHNFKRSCALLQLSLKDLGAMPAAAADCTK